MVINAAFDLLFLRQHREDFFFHQMPFQFWFYCLRILFWFFFSSLCLLSAFTLLLFVFVTHRSDFWTASIARRESLASRLQFHFANYWVYLYKGSPWILLKPCICQQNAFPIAVMTFICSIVCKTDNIFWKCEEDFHAYI